MSVSDEDFKRALSTWASGVCVVTVAAQGTLHGMAVSSFGSVSLRPKLISVCLAESSRTLQLALSAERFAVSVLSKQQDVVSQRFSSPRAHEERFPCDSYELGHNHCPLLRGALAHIECALFAAHTTGDHRMLIGEVQRAQVMSGEPLVYHARRYGRFAS